MFRTFNCQDTKNHKKIRKLDSEFKHPGNAIDMIKNYIPNASNLLIWIIIVALTVKNYLTDGLYLMLIR